MQILGKYDKSGSFSMNEEELHLLCIFWKSLQVQDFKCNLITNNRADQLPKILRKFTKKQSSQKDATIGIFIIKYSFVCSYILTHFSSMIHRYNP